ncbi:MAG TPA: pimeloyl-ACP methyl ester esterase BioH [Gammaproteobacteria bacterium]
MPLKVDSLGEGPDLVVLHGWALNCGLFDGIADALAARFRVHFIDLPGHGHNAGVELPANIDDVARLVLEAAPRNANWLGWSLGGQTALAAAVMAPERVTRLVTVASTPRLVAGPDWPKAVPESTLQEMARNLHSDFRRTVKDFLSLQVLGDEHAQALLRELRKKAYAHGEPRPASLATGLKILHELDLRPRLGGVRAPLLAVMGSRDRLAPPSADEFLAENVPDGRNITIRGAAHAPFISHPGEFMKVTMDFLCE